MTTAAHDPARPTDLVRQVVVLVGSLLAVVAAFVGSGALGGTPIAEAAGGALSAEATHVAPGSPAFSIWSVIYTGLVAYAVWQVLPGQREDRRRVGWLALTSMVLNAAWIATVQAAALALGVLVIVALLVVLCVILVRTRQVPARSRVETVVVDGTFGLYLGWVSVATVADVAAVLAAGDVDLGLTPDVWAVAVLVVVALVGTALAVYAGRVAVAAAMAWGLVWIAVARSTGEPASVPAAVAAAGAAAVIVVAVLVVRVRGRAGRPVAAA